MRRETKKELWYFLQTSNAVKLAGSMASRQVGKQLFNQALCDLVDKICICSRMQDANMTAIDKKVCEIL
jgi:hypothetical protein